MTTFSRRGFFVLPLGAASLGCSTSLRAAGGLVGRTPPTIHGTLEAGAVLLAERGQWNFTRTKFAPVPTREWQWTRDGEPIAGASDPLYVLTEGDIGSKLAVVEIVADAAGVASATSASTSAIEPRSARRVIVTSRGLKALTTTGAIVAGSSTLDVESAAGFAVGDQLIVEVGAEAGAGRPGTMGVGGSWPNTSYASTADRDADRTRPLGSYAWLRSDGSVHRYDAGKWTPHDPKDVYWAMAQPTALVARIQAIDGQKITLDKAAATAASGAVVYFDNTPVLRPLLDASGPTGHRYTLDNTIAFFPTGTFAFSDGIEVKDLRGLTLIGEGRDRTILKSPRGTPSVNFRIMSAQNCHVRDLHLLGNVREAGYGLRWRQDTSLERGWSATRALLFTRCSHCSASELRVTNPWTNAVGTQSSENVWAKNVECLSEGHKVYIQWMFQWADSRGGGAIDCSVTSTHMTGGFEAFRSSGVTFTRPVGVNAAFAMNSAGDWLIDRAVLTIKGGAQMSQASWAIQSPVVNINNNIKPPDASISLGGEIRGPVIVQLDYVNDKRESFTGIIIGPENPNVLVSGGYPKTAAQGGLIRAPDYGMIGGQGPRGIASDGDAVIKGVRVVGSPRTPGYTQTNSINFANANQGFGTVIDCIADTILAANKTGTQTNLAYLASSTARNPKKR